LLFFIELMHIFYHMRLSDHRNDAPHVEKLDAVVKAGRKQPQNIQELGDKLQLHCPLIMGNDFLLVPPMH